VLKCAFCHGTGERTTCASHDREPLVRPPRSAGSDPATALAASPLHFSTLSLVRSLFPSLSLLCNFSPPLPHSIRYLQLPCLFPSLVLAFICSPPYARLHMLGPVFASICRPLCLLASTRPPFPRPLRSLLSQATALLHPARRPAHSRHHCCQTPPMRRCAGPDAVPRTRVHSD
jgi:hypothetical protein